MMDNKPPTRAGTNNKLLARAVGEELRRARKKKGWSQEDLASQLPSKIVAETVMSYECGTRNMSFLRFLEICDTIDVGAPALLTRALHRARASLQNLELLVDVRRLAEHNVKRFTAIKVWARNRLIEDPSGVAELTPAAITALATLMACPRAELAEFLVTFATNDEQETSQ